MQKGFKASALLRTAGRFVIDSAAVKAAEVMKMSGRGTIKILGSLVTALVAAGAMASGSSASRHARVVAEALDDAYFGACREESRRCPRIDEDDVWALEFAGDGEPGCESVVTGYVKKPGRGGRGTYRFAVCIERRAGGALKGRLLEDEMVADE